MKRAVLALIFLSLLFSAYSQSNLVKQVAPGVYYREAEPEKRIIANTGWIVFRDYVLVIDANYPWGARAILNDLRQTTDKPIRYVFDTHYHADHAFGNSVMLDAGATVVCSEDCGAESRAKNPSQWANDTGTGDYSLKPYRLEHPQLLFRDKLVFDDGTQRVELLKVGPGHTRGDAVAYLPRQHILFTGDLVVNKAGNNMADPDADPDNWLRALDDLAMKDVGIVIPGHGPQGSVATIKGQRAYIADMIRQIRDGKSEVNLASHHPWGDNAGSNRTSARAVAAKLRR